jgi:chromosome segregation ATPase
MEETLTFEQMMTLFAEGRKETVELRKSIEASIASSQKDFNERFAKMEADTASLRVGISDLIMRMEKTDEQLKKTDERMEKTDERLEKTLAQMEINNHKVGELTNKLGGIIESIVLPDIVEKFNEKGFKFDSVCTRIEFLNEKKDGNLAEVDALLENGKFVIAVEAKTEMGKKDVNDHVKRLNVLRGLSRFRGKKIYGALATAVAKKAPVNYALEKGFYVLQQPNVMGVKILDFPKGHSAKAW